MVKVYLMRGLGEVFSNGLSTIANALNELDNVEATVYSHMSSGTIEKLIKESPDNVKNVVIGHSLGAKNTVNLVNKLGDMIDFAVSIDIPRFFPKRNKTTVPIYNFYVSTTLLGGQKLRGQYVINTKLNGTHIRIDSNGVIYHKVLHEVKELLNS